MFKNLLNSLKTFFICFIVLLLVSSTINYFDLINNKIVSIIDFIIILILYFITAFINARKNNSKGYLSGLISSIALIIIFSLLSLIFNAGLISSYVIFILLALSISIVGGMIGINTKKESKD